MNVVNISEIVEKKGADSDYFLMPFYFDGKPYEIDGVIPVKWGMTLLHSGTMRFRWNETNPNRKKLKKIISCETDWTCSGSCVGDDKNCNCKKQIVTVELIHSKIIVEAKSLSDTENVRADGVVTIDRKLVPAVTVADCVPVFLYDTVTGAFGAFHSGWKGTGICADGVRKMNELYGSQPQNICAAIGPHIGDCCYNVDEDRASYFKANFGESCVKYNDDCNKKENDFNYKLSLTEANLVALRSCGIYDENIVVASDCTCCSRLSNGKNVFGSFRREAAFLPPEVDADSRSKAMTVQAAFVMKM